MTPESKQRFFVGLALLAAGCGRPPSAPERAAPPDAGSIADPGTDGGATPDAGPALPPGVFAMAGLDPALPASDLAPLEQTVGSALYIGVGESIHTSGGYYAAKNRLIRDFVERLGVRALGIESPWTAAEATAKYVESCQGDVKTALNGIYTVFDDVNTKSLLTWLCQYNQAHPGDPVRFFGFDAKQPEADGPALQAFLHKVAPNDEPRLWSGASTCRMVMEDPTAPSTPAYPQADFTRCTSGLDAIGTYFDQHEAAIVAASSASELTVARVDLVSLQSWQGEDFYFLSDPRKSYEARDQAMAYILTTLHDLRFPNARTVVWAHNYHLSEDHQEVDGAPAFAATMGTHLHDQLGAAYAPIGLVGYEVGINWPGVGNGMQPPPTDGDSLELKLHDLGQPYLIVDTGSSWLGTNTYGLGWPSSEPMVPIQQFRALVFLDRSPPMQAVFW